MTKPYVIRPGDTVRVVNSKFVRRVGYPLVWFDLVEEVESDPRTWQAWNLLRGRLAPSTELALVVREKLPADFIKAIARLRVAERGFGGRERSLHYCKEPEPSHQVGRMWTADQPPDATGMDSYVYGRRHVKTGTHFPPGGDHEDYWPGGLADMKVHTLLTLAWGEIEVCNVELVSKGKMYTFTTQRQVRSAFWKAHPTLQRKRIPNYSGNGTMHTTDTRCAFTDWIDGLSKNGEISQDLAQRVTL